MQRMQETVTERGKNLYDSHIDEARIGSSLFFLEKCEKTMILHRAGGRPLKKAYS